MSDPHDAQDYTANGPTDAGFRTGGDNTKIINGAVLAGTECGVRGIGLETKGSSKPAIGVFGEGKGSNGGVVGQSETGTGVRGESRGPAAGVQGSGDPGVHGISQKSDGVYGEFIGNQQFTGSGIHGDSNSFYGGLFTSRHGHGVLGRSLRIAGVVGICGDKDAKELPPPPLRLAYAVGQTEGLESQE